MRAGTGPQSSLFTTDSVPKLPFDKCLLTEHKRVKVSWEESGLEGRSPLPSCENVTKLHNHVTFSFHLSKLRVAYMPKKKKKKKYPWKQQESNGLIFSEKQGCISSSYFWVCGKNQKNGGLFMPILINYYQHILKPCTHHVPLSYMWNKDRGRWEGKRNLRSTTVRIFVTLRLFSFSFFFFFFFFFKQVGEFPRLIYRLVKNTRDLSVKLLIFLVLENLSKWPKRFTFYWV